MNDIKAAVADILDDFDDSQYPEGFLEKYVQMERLAEGRGTETFLALRKADGQLCVAKCYDIVLRAAQEADILKQLGHRGLPVFFDEFQNDRMVCTVREYIEGKPLDQYRAENHLTEKDAADICLQLCDILIYLHEQEQPVIHRDIKPQNIIVKPDRTVCLIDFDIARIYHDGAKNDTEFIGTREFAPPEQYGFSQTDCRTDIYSLGVVLGWLLTGEMQAEETICKLGHGRMAGIYKKCVAFSPKDRFASARKLRSALLYADGERKKTILRWAAALLSCLIFLGMGFLIGRYTEFLSDALQPESGIVFEEPMIEQAVRFQLAKAADEILTEEDLLSVKGLYVFGDSIIAKDENSLHAEANRLFEAGQMREGSIRSLEDLTKMPNLREVFVSMQQVRDISPLAALPDLEIVDIKNNPVEDISPLSELKFLKRAALFGTHVTDLSPLSDCPVLSDLDAGGLVFRSLTPFEDLTGLRRLSLNQTTLDTLAGIDRLTQLTFFEVIGVIDGDLEPLFSLPLLKDVVLGEDMRFAAEAIADRAGFSISYR